MTAKRILIVEDEKAIRDMVAFGLRRAGYEVREAEDCREARARIVDVRPDLMLVDWMLPDMSGLELTRSLKRAKDTEEIPVIMQEWERRDSRIHYFRRTIPGNIAEATNFGLTQARGEYIAILDDDDYWACADKLSRQTSSLDQNPDFCCCGGR